MKYSFCLLLPLLVFSCNNLSTTNQSKRIEENYVYSDSLIWQQHSEIFKVFKQDTQKFEFKGDKEQQFEGINGTIITIQKGCFNVKEIVVELVECYSKMDMIKNALSTVTMDGKLLESQGMLYLKVTDTLGNILVPKIGKLIVKVPIASVSNCKFFNGKEEKGVIVWKENEDISITHEKATPTKERVKYPKYLYTYPGKNKGEIIRDTVWDYQYKEIVTSMNAFYSMFNPASLGWYNLDSYLEIERIDFVVNNKISDACIAIMMPHEYNTVIHCAPSMEYTLTELKLNKLPNLSADFLFLRYENKRFYFDIVTYQKGADKRLVIQLEEIKKEELDNILKKRYGKKFTNEISF